MMTAGRGEAMMVTGEDEEVGEVAVRIGGEGAEVVGGQEVVPEDQEEGAE